MGAHRAFPQFAGCCRFPPDADGARGEGFVDGSMTGTERECEENMGRAEKSGPTWKNGPAEDTKISRILKKMRAWRRRALGVLAAAMTAFQLYMKLAAPTSTRAQMPVYLCCALIVVFLFSPAAEKGKNKDSRRKKLWWIYDGVLIAAALFIAGCFLTRTATLDLWASEAASMTALEDAAAVLLLLVLLAAIHRVVPLGLFMIVLFFVAYAWLGRYIGGSFQFDGMSFAQFCKTLLGENGIFGAPLRTSACTLFYFMIFDAFFSACGGGGVLIDVGMKLSGKTTGGPAKAAVVSSGLMGMVSGSAVANVTTTGTLTIPLMKKAGYTPEEAGSVEAVASAGGQIMPPIMGIGAFIMAEMIGVPYRKIAVAAIIPALAYFGAALFLTHLLAKKKGLDKRREDLTYQGSPVLPRMPRLIPMILLVVMVFAGMSISSASICCTVLAIAIHMASRDTRMPPKKLLETLVEGVRQASNMAVPIAACGIISGIVSDSGVDVRVAELIGSSGNDSLLAALLLTAVCCLLLGMALPTVAAYLIASALFCTALQGLNVNILAANLFIFYFSVMAQITPPVCQASFTAAGIAEASVWKTGWKAFSFAITAFITPFMFVCRPAILLVGTAGEIAVSCLTIACATFFLAAGVAGYLYKDLADLERVLFFAAVTMLVLPDAVCNLIGIALGAAMAAWCFSRARGRRRGMST